MPIGSTILKKYGEKYIILVDGSQTLEDALQRLRESKYRENQTYFVISRADNQYQVASIFDLKNVVGAIGYDSFVKPLQTLPIPFASRVVSTNIPQSGQEILDWVDTTPQSTVVITEGDKVVGLFVNPNLSSETGLINKTSLLELHGRLVNLGKDPRSDFKAHVPPPHCPHCQNEDFFEYDPQQKVYRCRNCKQVVRLP